jgi:iron(III) transport system substrate-binding protein
MKKLYLVLVLLSFSICLFTLPVGGVKEAQAQLKGSITLYTSETLTDVQDLANAFMKANKKTKVDIYRSGTVEVTAKLQAEMEADSIRADVIWFADMAMFEDLGQKGLLIKTNIPEARNIPSHYVYMKGMAYEARLIFQIIAYNTDKVKKPVKGWKDLLDPAYRGKIGSASALYSGATLTQVTTLTKDPNFGWDFYRKLKGNDCKLVKGNGAVARNIATGEYHLGITIDFMARDLIEKGSPVAYVYQQEGSVYIPTPIGIMSTTQNQELAEAFINFVLGIEGQKILLKNGYVPLNKNAPMPAGVPSPADIKVLKTDFINRGVYGVIYMAPSFFIKNKSPLLYCTDL